MGYISALRSYAQDVESRTLSLLRLYTWQAPGAPRRCTGVVSIYLAPVFQRRRSTVRAFDQRDLSNLRNRVGIRLHIEPNHTRSILNRGSFLLPQVSFENGMIRNFDTVTGLSVHPRRQWRRTRIFWEFIARIIWRVRKCSKLPIPTVLLKHYRPHFSG